MNSAASINGIKVQGFTLIEVVLAMAITAFVSMLAYQGLSSAATAVQSHERQVKILSDIQLPLTVIGRDIRHVVLRPIIDEYGTEQGGLSGGALNDYPLVLTRRGWDNPRGLKRGGLQRVRYVLENEQLWRESWSVLDRINEESGQRRTLLLKGVMELKLAFLKPGNTNTQPSPLGGQWVDEWESRKELPAAVDIIMDVENFGRIRRVFGIHGY